VWLLGSVIRGRRQEAGSEGGMTESLKVDTCCFFKIIWHARIELPTEIPSRCSFIVV
jgi:hypothetical protein